MTQSPGKPNRLIDESSPYLLQHAYNPVDWHPWGEEAFALAVEQDKPVFLSVGYSACHWCHVMEHESFESDEIAALMNEHFINIKVDREERPDVDQIYMSAVQLMTQRGGWPMSVFLTPDKRPFYGGTYWPPTSRMGMPGFREILLKIHEVWTDSRDEVTTSATSLVEAVNRMAAPAFERSALNESVLRNAMYELLKSADRRHGGFGGAPKFPHPMDVRVLLRCWKRFGGTASAGDARTEIASGHAAEAVAREASEALDVVTLTLDKMARGGIYDHLGGGFHRYSTDARWLVPHFEKMLYDNALLVPAYLELGQAMQSDGSAEPWPFAVVRETLDYVLREMDQPEGGFYATQDADSEGEEGKYFVWSEAEIDELLPDADADRFKYAYDVTPGGNWEGNTILNRPKPHDEAARVLDLAPDDLADILARCRQTLFEAREHRVNPGRDDKVLVSWNGWMISAMAKASQVLGETRYAEAAVRAVDFVLGNMRNDESFFLHSFKDGRARFNAYLDDYAAFISGLCDLYQATFDPRHLVNARELATHMVERFADEDGGGFYFTSHDHEQLITRTKDSQDNATPSGSAQAATALVQLGRLTGDVELVERGRLTLESFSGLMSQHPRASGQGLLAVDALIGPSLEIVIVDGDDSSVGDEWLAAVHQRFLPNKVVFRRAANVTDEQLPHVIPPHLAGRTALDGQTTAYVCLDMTCGPPVTSLDELLSAISGA
ncbi:MAG: thioredoxin domain-containing protein [Planctomycetaceae bacterium]|nr:thioredoxin domain-containing protein [Planctomycetaceae bacterium]